MEWQHKTLKYNVGVINLIQCKFILRDGFQKLGGSFYCAICQKPSHGMKESAYLVNACVAHLPAAHVFGVVTAVLEHHTNGNTLCPSIFTAMTNLHGQRAPG